MKPKAIIIFCVLVSAAAFSIYQLKIGKNKMTEVTEISSDALHTNLIQAMNESPEIKKAQDQENSLIEQGKSLEKSQNNADKHAFLNRVPETLRASYEQKAAFIQRWKEGMITDAPEAENIARLALQEIKQLSLATELDLNLKVHFTPQETLDGLAQVQANLEKEKGALQALMQSFQEKQQANPNDPSLNSLQEGILQAHAAFVNQATFYMEKVEILEQARIREWHEKVQERGEDETNILPVINACKERIASKRTH